MMLMWEKTHLLSIIWVIGVNMKKLLLVLLLSVGFIGSTYANSIEGAFGYKLGQVVKNIPMKSKYARWKHFSPKKPLLSLNKYSIHTTLKEKRIYQIFAYYEEQSTGIEVSLFQK